MRSTKPEGGGRVRGQGRRRWPLLVGLALAVVGALALAAGITAATVLPVASTATSTASLGGSKAAVTVPGLLEVRDGAATVEVRGQGRVSLATARSEDLQGWLRADPPVDAASITGVAAGGDALEVEGTRAAAAGDVPSTVDSDLWLTRATGDGAATLEVPRGRQPVQVVALAPGGGLRQLSVSWPSEATNPWALPLLIGGGAVLLVGLVLMALGRRGSAGTARVPAVPAGDPSSAASKPGKPGKPGKPATLGRQKRQRKPSTAERPTTPEKPSSDGTPTAGGGAPRTGGAARRLALVPLVGTLVLAGCGTSEPLSPKPREEPGTAAILTGGQLDRVLDGRGGVVPTVEDADASLDAEEAARRLAGAPLDARSAAYLAATSVRDAEGGDPSAEPPVRPLAGKTLLAALPEAGAWPRSGVVVVQPPTPAAASGDASGGDGSSSDGSSGDGSSGDASAAPAATPVPVLEVLQQDTPRDPYKVVARANLLPGAVFPSLQAQDGTVEQVPTDGGDLVSPPDQVVADLADVLTLGPASTHATGFADSPFINTVLTEQVQQDEGSGRFVDYGVKHTPAEDQTWALRTADGGAVVVAVIDSVQSLVPNTPGSTLTLPPTLAAIGGAATASSQELTTAETVVVTVPAATGRSGEGAGERSLEVIGGQRDVTAVKLG